MLHIRCPHCDATMSVPDNLVGRSGRCGDCMERFVVRRPAQLVRPPRPRLTADEGDSDLEIISDDDAAEGTLIGAEDVVDSIWLEDEDESPIRITVDPGFPNVPREVLREVRETLQRKFNAAEESVFGDV